MKQDDSSLLDLSCSTLRQAPAAGLAPVPEAPCVQIIDNLAVYNSEGFMSTLELLPMWQNVDPDVDLFGSGIISELDEHDSEWGTGHALSNLSPLLLLVRLLLRIGDSMGPTLA